MDFKHLEYFLRVCKDRSMSKAANNLYISQQGLSTLIMKLENELNCNLFLRSVKGVVPTEEGLYFAEKAEQILEIYYECLNHFSSPLLNNRNALRVGASYGVMVKMATILFAQFHNLIPDGRLEICEYTDTKCEAAVESQEVDLGFVSGPIDNTRFDCKFIFQEPIRAIVNRQHPLADCDSIDIGQLEGIPIFISNNEFKTNHKFFKRCQDVGFAPQIDFVPNEIGMTIKAACENLGIGIANNYVANMLGRPEVKILPINDDSFVWDIYLIWKKDIPISKMLRRFIDGI